MEKLRFEIGELKKKNERRKRKRSESEERLIKEKYMIREEVLKWKGKDIGKQSERKLDKDRYIGSVMWIKTKKEKRVSKLFLLKSWE